MRISPHVGAFGKWNGVYISGNNSQGQLNLDRKKYPEVKGLMPHENINKTYEVVDIGCGSNHSVFLTIFK